MLFTKNRFVLFYALPSTKHCVNLTYNTGFIHILQHAHRMAKIPSLPNAKVRWSAKWEGALKG